MNRKQMYPITIAFLAAVGILMGSTKAATVSASVRVSYFNSTSNETVSQQCESGVYGLNSPLRSARGTVAVPHGGDLQACDPNTVFSTAQPPWVALIERGNCTFAEKISVAAKRGAVAAVIYNTAAKGNRTFAMPHAGAGSIVAIMISSLEGMEILRRIESGLKVDMVIEVGKKHGPLMNYYSILFISETLIILTVLITGYSTFYYARRFRISRAQRQLKAKARKALGKLQLRTLKEGDKETGPDGDTCVVCIDLYKPEEVVRILACNHVFHKICVDPWLLEHRTCPLCRYDILKVLSPEADEGAGAVSVQTRVYAVTSTVTFVNEVENSTENESSGDTSVQAPVEIVLVERQPPENDDACLGSDESQPSAESVLPPVENPTFEADETQVSEDKL